MSKPVIVGALRTPVGTFGKSLKDYPTVDLGAFVIEGVLKQINMDLNEIDEVIFGNVLQAGLGQNPARQAALKASIPVDKPSYTVNKVCGSGLKTIAAAAQSIQASEAEVVIAGGMENMSMAPYLLEKSRWGYRMGDGKVADVMVKDGLWCATNDYHMGITAENVAQQYGITRREQDEFALESQQRTLRAISDGRFKSEIASLSIPQKKGGITLFDTDEHPRDTTLGKLSPFLDLLPIITI